MATVSRVFNGYADVSDTTRARVMATAKRLDYAPSAAARTLVKQSSQLIGVILYTGQEHPDIQHPFFQEVLVGLKHGIGALGYDLLLFATEQPGSNSGKPHCICAASGTTGSTASCSWASTQVTRRSRSCSPRRRRSSASTSISQGRGRATSPRTM